MTYRYLDLIRAFAAILVLLSHSRAFFLVEYDEVTVGRSALVRLIYFLSGFGHQSVLVFFVLSGFLISGSVVRSIENGSWTWSNYAIHRLVRLLVVLVPCLVLTVALDTAAIHLSHSGFYTGATELSFGSGPPREGVSLDVPTVIGNLLFLQTIWVPVLGSNGPLWSLANEFWYYLLFPLMVLAWSKRGGGLMGLAYLGSALSVAAAVITPSVLALFPVWLLGFAVWLADRRAGVKRVTGHLITLIACGLLFAMALILARINVARGWWGDVLFATSFMLLMACLLDQTRATHPLLRISDKVAAMSFSLYLLHFPLLAFLHATLFRDQRCQPDAWGIEVWLCATLAVFTCCAVLYLVFEARTATVRRAVLRLLARHPRSAPAAGGLPATGKSAQPWRNPSALAPGDSRVRRRP